MSPAGHSSVVAWVLIPNRYEVVTPQPIPNILCLKPHGNRCQVSLCKGPLYLEHVNTGWTGYAGPFLLLTATAQRKESSDPHRTAGIYRSLNILSSVVLFPLRTGECSGWFVASRESVSASEVTQSWSKLLSRFVPIQSLEGNHLVMI